MNDKLTNLLKQHPSRYTERFSETISVNPLAFVVVDVINYNYIQALTEMFSESTQMINAAGDNLTSNAIHGKYDIKRMALISLMMRFAKDMEGWQVDLTTMFDHIKGEDVSEERLLSLLEKHLIIAEGFK